MTTAPVGTTVELNVGGMTCASCAARIEKKLNRMDGVTASVNFATEKARVQLVSGIDLAEVVATVEATGYTAALPPTADVADADSASGPEVDEQARVADGWRRRLVVSAAFTVPVVVLAMAPALQFRGWQWVSLLLATPVICWGGWPFTGPRGRMPGTPPPPWTR